MCMCSASGVDGLSRKLQDVKDFVDERVEALSSKQDSLAENQHEMKDQLDEVQGSISQASHSCDASGQTPAYSSLKLCAVAVRHPWMCGC